MVALLVSRQLVITVQLFAKVKKEKGISEDVGYEVQKDESTVPGASKYNQRLDSVVGYCGKKGDDHECDDECCIVIGDGDDAWKIITDAHATQQLAGYLALAVIVPLDERLPRIALVAHATCNRFTAAWQRRQWRRIEALADELISPVGEQGSNQRLRGCCLARHCAPCMLRSLRLAPAPSCDSTLAGLRATAPMVTSDAPSS